MLPRTNYFYIIFFAAALNLCDHANTKEQQFKITVQQIIDGFSKQDSVKISKYINKATGIYLLHRIGIFDTYHHSKTIIFSDSTYPEILFRFSKGIKNLPLNYSSLPTYDCEKWDKKGLFVDTTKIDHIVSEICKTRNEHRPDTISTKTIQFFNNLENKSRRVVLVDKDEKELIFYLSYLNRRWYLTIIDSVTSDCSV